MRDLYAPICCLFLAFSFTGCEIPGCGPGDLPHNPLSSNLVDYTVPASQSILRSSRFLEFGVVFLRPMLKGSFSVSDDLAMCRLEPDAGSCDFSAPEQRVDVESLFVSTVWSCYASNVCLPASPDYDPTLADMLELAVDPRVLAPGKYLLRINKDGATPLVSRDGHHLDENVYVYLTLVADDAPTERPQIDSHNLGEYLDGARFLEPHRRIEIRFDKPMGFINFKPFPLPGFHFRYQRDDGDEVVGLESDSVLGLAPGQEYTLRIIGEDVLSGGDEHSSKGPPPTMDSFGNILATTADLRFQTSHVRIVFPFHEPFSHGPDDWYGQLEEFGYLDSPIIMVEVSADVQVISSVTCEGEETPIPFYYNLSEDPAYVDREGNVVVTIPIDREQIRAGSVGYPSLLQVNAYGEGGTCLGSDSLLVHAFPPAPTEIKIVTYNAYSHNYINVPDVPPECQQPPWSAKCLPCWIDWLGGGTPELCSSEECTRQWPDYCHEFWPWPPAGAIGWKERLDNFARHIVAVYRPAIIAVQEVYLDSTGCWEDVCSNCDAIDRGTWLRELQRSIQYHIGGQGVHYHLATTVKSGVGNVCFGNEWEGEAIIYDPQQVLFVPAYPPETGGHPFGCYEWSWGIEEFYEFDHPEYNDCFTKNNTRNAEVSRAIFEFPRGSGYFFSFYNTHIHPCRLASDIYWIIDKQNTFRSDLPIYLNTTPAEERLNGIYPPIFAGDMNTQWLEECLDDSLIRALIRYYFTNAPDKDDGWLDKVWIGKDADWDNDMTLDIMLPEDVVPPVGFPFVVADDPAANAGEYGYRVIHNYNSYSDHSPAMVVVKAPRVH